MIRKNVYKTLSNFAEKTESLTCRIAAHYFNPYKRHHKKISFFVDDISKISGKLKKSLLNKLGEIQHDN